MSAAVIESLAFRNPSSALSVIDELNDPTALDRLHNHMMTGWARSDFKDDSHPLHHGNPQESWIVREPPRSWLWRY